MIKLEHVAIWARDIETLRQFYVDYFGAGASERYVNADRHFQSYFLRFAGGARLELMQRPDVAEPEECTRERMGYAHLAISVGSERAVDELSERLTQDGYQRLSGPRRTGDGYYESLFLDPEGNRLEITS